jgi:hypothetical protein
VARKRKVRTPEGREVEGTVIPFRINSENFNEYVLEDGTVLRLKVVVQSVMRVEGEQDPLGNPAYVVLSTNVVSVDPPDESEGG